ncbi:MAG TPA: SDR family oxidoreductase [Micromonosporaceae bacterium]
MTAHDWLGLAGKRVVVAGAGGLGRACVAGYLDGGACVTLIDADADRLAEVDAELGLTARGGGVIQADLSAADSARDALTKAHEVLGGLDVMLHAVGVNLRQPVVTFTDEQWRDIVDINLSSAFFLGREAGRHMCAQGYGRIVYLSSVSGLLAHQNHAPYAATKGGINQLLRVMAAEWAAHGVTVNGVAPGYVETPLTREYLARPGVREHLTGLVPAGRLGIPDDVVGPVLFLSSDQASFVTGHILYVDGGRTLV